MSQNVNRNGLKLKEGGPVWKIKVGILTHVYKSALKSQEETKFWEIKIMLN